MAERHVVQSGKDPHTGDTRLCNPRELWSPVSKALAISDIESGLNTYSVPWTDGRVTQIRVVNGPTGKYLRTDHDTTQKNNLEDLPDC
jgi:hypothetical protein